MNLDPFSPTLISDWAAQAFGIELTAQDKSRLTEWLRGQEVDLNAERLLPVKTDVSDVFVLGRRTNRNTRSHKRVLELYVSHRGQAFQRLNDIVLDSPEARSNLGLVIKWIVTHFRNHLTDKRINKLDLPWRFIANFGAEGYPPKIAGMPKEVAKDAFKRCKSIIKKGQRYIAPEAVAQAESLLPVLTKALRRRLRLPERQAIREIVSLIDREALKTMRRLHNFDNRLYAWLIEPQDDETRRRRRQFAETFPMVIYHLYKILPTTNVRGVPELSHCIDGGVKLLEGEGLERIKEVFSVYTNGRDDNQIKTRNVLLQTARALAVMRPILLGDKAPLFFSSIPALNQIPPKHWPAGEHLCFVDALARNMPENAFQRLIKDTGADWEGLYDFAGKAVERRYRAIADTETYRCTREAEAAGQLVPVPVKPNEVSAGDIESVATRVRDYINMVIDRTLVPAYFAAGRTMAAEERKELSDKLFACASFKQLVDASEAWHEPRRRDRLAADLQQLGQSDPEFSARVVPLSWLPLIATFKVPEGVSYHNQNRGSVENISGLIFTELTTPQQLSDEGNKMNHCVGAYSTHCLERGAVSNHIIHLDDKDGVALSTIHLRRKDDPKEPVKIMANLSFHDRAPPARAIAAGRWLGEGLKAGRIKEATSVKERQAHREKISAHKIEASIGYDALKPDVLAKAFALVRPAFPQGWRKCKDAWALLDLANAAAPTINTGLRDVLATTPPLRAIPLARAAGL